MKISISDSALLEIKKVISKRKKDDKNDVRVYIKGIGWGGPSFGIALDEQEKDDYNEVISDINFVVENSLLEQYGSFSVDYSNNWMSRGFIVNSDYRGSSC